MSWAAAIKTAKDVAPSSSARPKQVVFAPVVEPDTMDAADRKPVTHRTVCSAVPAHQKGLLVLDANAFIKGMDNFDDVADVLVTTAQVLAEVRDRAARDLLDRLQHTLHVLEPSKGSLAAVVAVAKKTGDLGAMSRTDLHVCALALDCCEATDTRLAPIEPRPAEINPNDTRDVETVVADDNHDGKSEENGEWCHESNDASDSGDEDDAGEEDDDEEGWITPENIHEILPEGEMAGERFEGGVACVTSDYAMQNTLMHLGVPIVGPRGMRIQELRRWLLRCTSCFAIASDTTRQFCGMCGSGNTLRRVQYVLTSSGERQLFINFRKPISTRGTVYNLPKPRGGRRGTNRCLVLREDQLAHVIRGTTSTKLREKYAMGGNGNDDELAAFGEAPKQRKRDPNQPRMFSSYHKYNMNEKKKVRASRRK